MIWFIYEWHRSRNREVVQYNDQDIPNLSQESVSVDRQQLRMASPHHQFAHFLHPLTSIFNKDDNNWLLCGCLSFRIKQWKWQGEPTNSLNDNSRLLPAAFYVHLFKTTEFVQDKSFGLGSKGHALQ